MESKGSLQEWVWKISGKDRQRLAHATRFNSHPRELNDLFTDLRSRYDFIPREPVDSEVETDGCSTRAIDEAD